MIDPGAIIRTWSANGASGKRAFHDKYPGFIALAQKLFLHWAESSTPHTPWFEFGSIQLPADCMAYLELVLLNRPKVLIECGSCSGASAAMFAEMMRRIVGPEFKVITIEFRPEGLQKHLLESDPNIVSIVGDTTEQNVVDQVRSLIPEGWPTMVTLDSAHDGLHVCREIELYAPMVTSGQYLLVQDTFLGLCWGGNLLPAQCHEAVARGDIRAFDYHNCPLGAVEALLDTSDDFVVDLDRQRYVLTLHPFGFLKRRG